MFDAKDIDFATLEPDECDTDFEHGTGAGRGFAVGGGVAAAVFFGYLAAVLFKPKMKS